jgi:hypothetical protein
MQCHSAPRDGLEKSLSEQHSRGIGHTVNQMGKTQCKPLAAQLGMCERAFKVTATKFQNIFL